MKVFTVNAGVTNGATVRKHQLSSGIEIPVVMVGESGRGRKLAFLPVALNPSEQKEFDEKGKAVLLSATIGKTRNGGTKLISAPNGGNDAAIVVLETQIGFRGSNDHLGDRAPEWTKERPIFHLFPGEVLADGQIAQGIAGNMGSGKQLIAVMPKDKVFRTSYDGRMYGAPSSHYYVFTGPQILCATWEEREASDLF